MKTRVLVAGIGNVFLGDDGFGVEVVRRLSQRTLPEGVHVVDFGIRGLDLTYALLDGYETAILVDATSRGQAAGTLYVLEPETADHWRPIGGVLDTHGMDPARVLALARAMGGRLPTLRVVGCEPATFGDDEGGLMGLSAPVEAAVDEAVRLVERLLSPAAETNGHA
jgi:hydrogenase maturation protease